MYAYLAFNHLPANAKKNLRIGVGHSAKLYISLDSSEPTKNDHALQSTKDHETLTDSKLQR